jgi:hypothetical protein
MSRRKRFFNQVTSLITRNWREKLVALILAFLFWYLVRGQATIRRGYLYDLPSIPAPGQL